jgi:hypothetical protein
MFGSLTVVMGGLALALSPRERRIEYLLHITLVTMLTVSVVKIA